MTDEELVRSFQRTRDNRHFEELVRRHIVKIRRLLLVVAGGSIEDREDLEQDVLAELYLSLPKFRFQSSFTTYCYRFCRNKAIDHIRRQARKRRRDALHLVETAGTEDPAEWVLAGERLEAVRTVLSSMEEEQRTMLYLKDVEDVSVRELARIFGIPAGTVKSRLSRIRAKLARELRRVGIEEDVV